MSVTRNQFLNINTGEDRENSYIFGKLRNKAFIITMNGKSFTGIAMLIANLALHMEGQISHVPS